MVPQLARQQRERQMMVLAASQMTSCWKNWRMVASWQMASSALALGL
jgi:hypothetical protein